MGVRINTNVLAMSAARYAGVNDRNVSSSIEKLSSGLRINRAADDAAGLVISEGMRAQISGLDQAIRNSNEAINMVKTVEGSLNEVHELLRSMRSLAVHAANTGVNNAGSIAADQAQFDSAAASINRIGSNSEFNGKLLFTGALGITGTSSNATNASFLSAGTDVAAGTYAVTVGTAATRASLATTGLAGVSASTSVTINGVEIKNSSTGTAASLVAEINAASARTGVTATLAGGEITFTNVNYGNLTAPNVGFTGATVTSTAATAGVDAVVTVTGPETATQVAVAGSGRTVTLSNGLKLNVGGAAASTASVTVVNNAPQFQVGANSGQTENVAINAMNATVLGVGSLNLGTAAGANAALAAIDAAITDISTRRGALGAFQKNVLESNVNSLSVAKETWRRRNRRSVTRTWPKRWCPSPRTASCPRPARPCSRRPTTPRRASCSFFAVNRGGANQPPSGRVKSVRRAVL